VHGFNVSFEDALFRNAQIIWDMQYEGLPVLFSWASRARLDMYAYDRNSALVARDSFVELLETLKHRVGVRRIHVVAHSMGNLVVLEALANHLHADVPLSIEEVILAAPDIDRDQFQQIAARVRAVSKGVTLYASSVDRALAAARQIAGSIPRAGDVSPEGPCLVEGVDAIDVTPLGIDYLGLNHGPYAEQRTILADIKWLITTGRRPPHKRSGDIQRVPDGSDTPQYWRYSA
jgi:esterase/lipase superfamily enzyme